MKAKNILLRFLFSAAVVTIISFVLIALTGCGGGSGGGDTGTVNTSQDNVPGTGPGDTENIFPDTIGNTWYYEATTTGGMIDSNTDTSYFHTVKITGTKILNGVEAKIFEGFDSNDSSERIENYYSKDANAITYLGNNDLNDPITTAIVPYTEVKFPVTSGLVSTIARTNVDFGEDLDSDGKNEHLDFTLKISVDAYEPVEVPVGYFSRSARGAELLTGNLKSSSTSQTVLISSAQTLWAVPGIGIVKETLQATPAGQTAGQSYVLRGYVVNGVGHGMSVPYNMIGGLAPGDSATYFPGPPHIASDGKTVIVTTIRQTGVVGTLPVTQIIAAISDITGNTIKIIELTAPQVAYRGGCVFDVFFDGANYLVLYSPITDTSSCTLYGMRISPTGGLLDGSEGFAIADAPSFAASAVGGDQYLVVFTRCNNNTNWLHQLFGRFVSLNGEVLGTEEFPIGARDQNQVSPDVAFDGSKFLVTWQQAPGSGSEAKDQHIYGAVIDPSDAVHDAEGFNISTAPGGQSSPRIAFGSENYMVVWLDQRGSTGTFGYGNIYATRITPDGQLLDGSSDSGGIVITDTSSYSVRAPNIIYAGGEFIVTWAGGSYASVDPNSGIFAARLNQDGTLAGDSGGLLISGQPPKATYSKYEFPSAVALNNGVVIVWENNTESFGSTKGVEGVTIFSFE
jgi:hypothetical protein